MMRRYARSQRRAIACRRSKSARSSGISGKALDDAGVVAVGAVGRGAAGRRSPSGSRLFGPATLPYRVERQWGEAVVGWTVTRGRRMVQQDIVLVVPEGDRAPVLQVSQPVGVGIGSRAIGQRPRDIRLAELPLDLLPGEPRRE